MSDKIEITLHSNHKDIEKGLKELAENAKNKRKMLRELGHTVVNYIDETFETESKHIGDKWVDWSEYYKKVCQKIGGKILQLNGVLRKNITGTVRKDSVIISTGMEYAAVHNFGFKGPDKNGRMMNIPQREFFRFTEYDWMNLEDEIMQNIAKRLDKQNEWG